MQVSQEKRSVFWEVIVSVILSRTFYMYMCFILNGFRDRAISLYSSKIVDKKEILPTVPNTGIYCSTDKVGTVYLVKYIFENSTVSVIVLCNSCEDMACCSSVLYSERALSRKPFGIGLMCISTFLFRMTDTMTSQNIDLFSWNPLYVYIMVWRKLCLVLQQSTPSVRVPLLFSSCFLFVSITVSKVH
jgi:ABC-type polysaccharide/polyol phosphate export permease